MGDKNEGNAWKTKMKEISGSQKNEGNQWKTKIKEVNERQK